MPDSASKIVSNLLTFARQHAPQRTTTSINEVIASTLELRRYALKVHGVELEERLDPALPALWADPFQLQQVFLNLLGNAEQALRGWEGERRITRIRQQAKPGGGPPDFSARAIVHERNDPPPAQP